MATELWLQEARTVLAEPGYGLTYDFGLANAANVVELLRRGVLTAENCWYDPVAGHFLPSLDPDLDDTSADGWDQDVADDWIEVQPYHRADGTFARALEHVADEPFGLWTRAEVPAGQPRQIRLITFEGLASPLIIELGGVWRLALAEDGSAELAERVTTADGTVQPVTRSHFTWMTAPVYAPADHRLLVYEVGPKLVVRNLSPEVGGGAAGTVYHDLGAAEDPDQADVDAGREPPKHALRAGTWRFSGAGRVAIACARQRYRAGTCRLSRATAVGVGAGGSTMPAAVRLHGLGVDGDGAPTVSLTDQDGNAWEQSGDPVEAARNGLRWSIEWAASATSACYLSALSLRLPPVMASDGNTGTDVLSLPSVADQRVRVTREGDLTREHLAAALFTAEGNLAPYAQPNMSLRYTVDGVTLFRGLTDQAEWTTLADTSPAVGLLLLQAQGLWKRFRKARWPGGSPFDGRLLTDCLAELLGAAGLTAADWELAAWGYRFPTPPEGEAPALVYREGTPVDRILEDLQRKFYGAELAHYFRPSDGKFVLQTVGQGQPAATFYETHAAAVADQADDQVLLDGSYQETLDESALANVVTVVGQAPDRRPLVARAVDWASLRDPSVFNYVGETWRLTVADPGLQTQAAVNYVCRSLFARHRYPRVAARWQSCRLNVFPGQVVKLVGPHHGGTTGRLYRLVGTSSNRGAQGDEADPAGRCSYSAEAL